MQFFMVDLAPDHTPHSQQPTTLLSPPHDYLHMLICAYAVEGGIAVNIGDMLSRWSDGRLYSNLHRLTSFSVILLSVTTRTAAA